jgi:branched-chain amino acid transport system permease protein
MSGRRTSQKPSPRTPEPTSKRRMKLIPYIQAMVNGLLVGSLYSVIAMGLTIIFGVMRVINMAHGELIMLGMYVAFWVYTLLGMGQMAALLISLPLFLVLGAAIYGGVVNRVERRAGEMGTLLVTAGLSYLVANAAQLVWKADFRSLPSALTARSLFLGGISLNYSLLWAFLAAVLLTAITYLFLIYTDAGRAIRATAQDREAAALMGVQIHRINMLAFALGTALAGMAGVLLTPVFYVYPYVGRVFLVKAFVVVVLGGMGSILGAWLGGLLLGIVESVASLFIPSGYRDAVGLVIFLLVLLFKPSGLFGRSRV